MSVDSLSLDLILHMAGLALVIGIWFAAIMGIAQICRGLRLLAQRNWAGQNGENPNATAAQTGPRMVPSPRLRIRTARPLFMPTLASR